MLSNLLERVHMDPEVLHLEHQLTRPVPAEAIRISDSGSAWDYRISLEECDIPWRRVVPS